MLQKIWTKAKPFNSSPYKTILIDSKSFKIEYVLLNFQCQNVQTKGGPEILLSIQTSYVHRGVGGGGSLEFRTMYKTYDIAQLYKFGSWDFKQTSHPIQMFGPQKFYSKYLGLDRRPQ